MSDIISRGRRVVRLERESLAAVEERLGDAFARAVQTIVACDGRLIVAGVGKSGLIGRKIAATFTSTGTPATFLHPVESVHGDLGLVGPRDVAILISKSGQSDEMSGLLDHLKRMGVRTIAITGNLTSPLARECDIALDGSVREEACSLDLAPTSSTTVALALGDALAVTVYEQKGFNREDFARLHPGGALGRRLLLRVSSVMLRDDLPLLVPSATMRETVVNLAERRGIAVAVDDHRRVLGVFTAGDMTRVMEQAEGTSAKDVFGIRLGDVMTKSPKTAKADELASAVVYRMEQHGIMAMPVVDEEGSVVGVVHLHDLMRAGAK